ncbi:phage tail protein I [Desulfosporosinus sp. OT]|uniref:phage tail protein I n=1 Tax=Desulfosporosinus sp. OT TaxID=913865 RepID=UPI000223A5CD|nr:phage tail protein I [Desulfosporosinus sp. OT]EGW39154.1 phage tail protein I [Desulfosporosinus sp. OT]
MDLSNVDLLSLQSPYMQKDPTTIALCKALNPQLQQLAAETKLCLIYPRIGELDEPILDELAWQFHVDWYDATADITVKRQLIKTAIIVHMYRGTPYAVEQVIQMYFGDGYVEEWFDYGGQPGMFKVVTSNPTVTAELANQFIKVLNSAKRKSAHLEEILIALDGEFDMYLAGVVHTGDYIQLGQVV